MSNELKRMIHSFCIGSDDPVGAMDNFLGWMIDCRESFVQNDTDRVPYEDKLTDLELQSKWWRGGK